PSGEIDSLRISGEIELRVGASLDMALGVAEMERSGRGLADGEFELSAGRRRKPACPARECKPPDLNPLAGAANRKVARFQFYHCQLTLARRQRQHHVAAALERPADERRPRGQVWN